MVRTLGANWHGSWATSRGGIREAKKAYTRIEADDERATSPGDVLRELMNDYAPCLILIDEWVAYARQLHDQDRRTPLLKTWKSAASGVGPRWTGSGTL